MKNKKNYLCIDIELAGCCCYRYCGNITKKKDNSIIMFDNFSNEKLIPTIHKPPVMRLCVCVCVN